jgi:hypothetical protein
MNRVPRKLTVTKTKKDRSVMPKTSKKLLHSDTADCDTIPVDKKTPSNNASIIWQNKLDHVRNRKIILSKAIGDTYGFQFTGFDEWNDQALDLIRSGDCIYEDFLICKPYIDYEFKIPIDIYTNRKNEYEKTSIDWLKHMCQYIYDAMCILRKENNDDFEIMITKSHGSVIPTKGRDMGKEFYKFSFHFVVNGCYRFKNSVDAKQLEKTIQDISVHPEITKYIDSAVYRNVTHQKMRCIYSNKTCIDTRRLIPIDKEGNELDDDEIDITKYLISHIDHKGYYLVDEVTTVVDEATHVVDEATHVVDEATHVVDEATHVVDEATHVADTDCEIKYIVSTESGTVGATKNKTKKNKGQNHNQNIDVPHFQKPVPTSDEAKQHMNIIIEKLRQVIPSARFVDSGKTDPESRTTFFAFDYNHTTHTCVHKTNHDKICGYAYIKDGSIVYAGCHSEKCSKKGVVKLDNIHNTKYLDTINDKLKTFTNKFVWQDKKTREQINSYLRDDKQNLMCLISQMNTGKTRALKHILSIYLKANKDAKILVISTRRSYANNSYQDIYSKHGFANYIGMTGQEMKIEDKIVISLESFHNLTISEKKYFDLVILDEIESILTQFFSETLDNRNACYNEFMDTLKYANKIIMCDADIGPRSIEFAESISSNSLILRNLYKGQPRKFIMMNDQTIYENMIRNDINDGKNIAVATLCRTYGLALRDKLIAEYPDIADKIVCFHGKMDSKIKNELNDVRTHLTKYRVFIYTTTISCGVNYDIPNHFYKVYGFIIGHKGSPREFLQMIGRIRLPIDTDVRVLLASNVSKRLYSLIFPLEYAEKYCASILPKIKTDTLQVWHNNENGCLFRSNIQVKSMWNRLRSYFVQENELNNTNNNILSMLKILIGEKSDIFEAEFESGSVKKTEMKTNIDRILEVENVTDAVYDKLKIKAKKGVSERENLIMEKVQMRHDLHIIDTVSDNELNSSLKIYAEKIDCIDRVMEYYDVTTKKNDDNNVDDLKKCKKIHINSAYKKIVDKLECEFVKKKTFDCDDFETNISEIVFTKQETNSIKSLGKAKKPYQIIKMVLNRFGIDLIIKYKTVKKGKYMVNQKKYEIMYNEDVMNIVFCKTHNQNKKYNSSFVEIIKTYDKNKLKLVEHKVPIKKIF